MIKRLGLINSGFIIYAGLCGLGFLATSRNICIWMLWNAFLAWVAIFLLRIFTKYKAWPFAILGVLFLPNAFYMFTDFIHVNELNLYQFYSYFNVVYTESLTPWIELFLIAGGFIFGWIVGLRCIQILAEKFKRPLVIPVILALLCGAGIWMGRFLRVNSWDIFRPFFLAEYTIGQISWFAVGFALLFATAIFASYLVFSRTKFDRAWQSSAAHKSPKSRPKSQA